MRAHSIFVSDNKGFCMVTKTSISNKCCYFEYVQKQKAAQNCFQH